ncbi:MAG: tetratricopeptide repeat protein [Thermoplasmata archaeon]|nr:tetratricopeptide repeat protein [Thermoplasmata archaeon]
MEELNLPHPDLIGREDELNILKDSLDNALAGNGSTVFIAGEAGVGKTCLTDAFRDTLAGENLTVLSGAADADSTRPFLVLSNALGEVIDKPLFEEQELKRFVKIFVVNRAGLLVAQVSSEEEDMDADIFAGMLSAVQDFVRDSFEQDGREHAHLGRLEYGDMKILMEHGQHLFLTTVIRGSEHTDMKGKMKRTLQKIEEKNREVLESWSGNIGELAPVQEEISKLADIGFLVRKDLEGVRLESERIRIANDVLEALKRLSAEKPLAIFLEDLHWTDESSLFVTNYLARNIRKNPILILATLRPRESDSLQKVMESMKNEEIINEITLEKLDIKNTILLIERTFSPNDFPDTLAEQLFSQSKGNPLFVIEMLRGMHDDGNISKKDGKYTLVSDSYQIPASVEEVVNHRLDALDSDSMAMVEYASCIGQRFDASIAESSRLLRDTGASMEKLLALGILLKKGEKVEFSHAVFQSVIYNGIGERWRTGHHKNIGEYFENAYVGRLDEVVYDLARHFSRTKEYGKCSEYCTRAGEKAEGSFAVEQALEFYNDALAALSRLDVNYTCEKILDVLERSGDIQTLVGSFEEAISNFMKAKETTDEKEFKARMLRKVGMAYDKMGEYDRGLETLVDAKEHVDEGAAEYGRILLLEGISYVRKGNYDKPMPLFLEAIEIAEKVGGKKKDLGNAFRVLGATQDSKGEYDLAMQNYEKSLTVMESIGDQLGIAAALNNIGVVHNGRGEFDKAAYFHGRSLEIREKIGDMPGVALSLNNIGSVYIEKGELDKALGIHKQSLEIREKIGDKSGVAMSLGNIGNVYASRGELDTALDFYGRSLEIREKIGDRQGVASSLNNIGVAYLDKGELDRALEFHKRSLEINLEIGGKLSSIYSYSGLAEAQLGLERFQVALENAEKAVRVALEIGTKSEEGRSRRILGTVHRERKNWDRASEEFEKANTILDEIGNKEELARAYYEHALLFKTMGDPAKAREYLERALAGFERIGMELWADKTRKALNDL